MKNSRLTKGIASAAFVLAALGAGTAIIGAASANAATNDTPIVSASATAPDPTKPMRSDEQLLTGDTATKVTELALAQYPGATIQRVETDSDGVYEAHIVTAAGDMVIVQVGADFTFTGTQAGGPGGSGGAPDANGAPTAPTVAGTAPSAPASSSA